MPRKKIDKLVEFERLRCEKGLEEYIAIHEMEAGNLPSPNL